MNTLTIIRRPATFAATAAVLATLAFGSVAAAQAHPQKHGVAPAIAYISPYDRHTGGHVMLGE